LNTAPISSILPADMPGGKRGRAASNESESR
jgi:hypothetical protein